MNKSRVLLVVLLVAVLLGAAGYYFWQQQQATPPAPVPTSTPVAGPVTPAVVTPLPSTTPAAPVVQHPVQAIETPPAPAPRPLPPLDASDAQVRSELIDWLGRKDVQGFLQLEGFVRRVVATVDNLGLEHAPPSRWPVQTTPGRFTTLPAADGQGEVISPDNERRYTPFVLFVESLDLQRAVQLYVRLYPLFQQAYEELGYPGKHFNDRLVAVIDLLLATPVQDGPLAVTLLEVKGPIPSERPWLRYEYRDPALESLSAGQKILIRSGPVNHRRLKARLLQIRKLVTRAPLPAAVKP